MKTFTHKQHPNKHYALGVAVDLLRGHQPFAQRPFGELVGALSSQIDQGYYFLTFDGDEIVGYLGWTKCNHIVAKTLIETGRKPQPNECQDGDTVLGSAIYSAKPGVCQSQARYIRQMFPEHHCVFARDYNDGRVIYKDVYIPKDK